MPSPFVGADKLAQATISAQKKMGRNLQAANPMEVGVSTPIQAIGEQALYRVPAVKAGRQADRVQHNQIDRGT